MKANTGVFESYGEDTISIRGFYFFIAMSLIWGLVITVLIATIAIKSGYHPGTFGILICGLGLPALGIYFANAESKVMTFIGYNFIVIPFGAILGPVLNHYRVGIIEHVFAMTTLVTVIMGMAGILLPQIFSKIGGALFVALLGLLIVRILQSFIPTLAQLKVIDYVAAGIFSLYIGYDMYRASVIQKTVANAILVSISLYLDVVNLFLSLLGSESDS